VDLFISLRKAVELYGPLDEVELFHFASSLAACLNDLHTKDEVFGTLSSETVWVSSEGVVKIASSSDNVSLSQISLPEYIPPEVLTGKRAVAASDMYQLGLLLHEAASGNQPFDYIDLSERESAIYSSRPFDNKLKINVKFQRLINKCCEKACDKRYQSAGQFFEDLSKYKQDVVSSAKDSLLLNDINFQKWWNRKGGRKASTVTKEISLPLPKSGFLKSFHWKLPLVFALSLSFVIFLFICFYGALTGSVINDLRISFQPSRPASSFAGKGEKTSSKGSSNVDASNALVMAVVNWKVVEGYDAFMWKLNDGKKLIARGTVKTSSFLTCTVFVSSLKPDSMYQMLLFYKGDEVGGLAFTCPAKLK